MQCPEMSFRPFRNAQFTRARYPHTLRHAALPPRPLKNPNPSSRFPFHASRLTMEQEIVSLATQCHLLTPVGGKGAAKEAGSSVDKENQTHQQGGQAAGKQRRADHPTIPYQALPVTQDTIITHNITPALPVIEHQELSKEVRAAGPLAAWSATGLLGPVPALTACST